ncbi:MAG: L,D-transpeptidase [Nannocystis sp.]|uniref:L,D-transpeptidase n=1 Tax=Nannocystis sp. TaxID=1962667 RepID=UPI0024296822|nr:L,D-transpeptidase [Nannocystis sp.]MBK9758222.1 L,D-transpeptidase [Nannocystis sp.]
MSHAVKHRSSPLLFALSGLLVPVSALALLLWACDDGEVEGLTAVGDRAGEVTSPGVAVEAVAGPVNAEAGAEEGEPEEADEVEVPEVAAEVTPSGLRVSPRTLIVYAAPRYGSDMRGRIDADTPFAIYGLVEGTGCAGEGWALAGAREGDGYVCLKTATVSEAAPELLPLVPEGLVVPYLYAKPRADRKGKLLAEVPRYRSRYSLMNGREPVDYLEANRQYAFVDLRPLPGFGKIYEDADEQVVPAQDMKAEKPSEFAGRVLADVPVTEGRRAAWVVSHEALLRGEPKLKAPTLKELEFHAAIEVLPELQTGGGARWVTIPDALGPGVPGYIESGKVRWFEAGPELTGLAEGETWIDVDLQQQMLAVMVGQAPIFLTLISSGTGAKPNTSTPKGVYRIRNKLALGSMRNRPEDAQESPYHVEAVPWVQYFDGRFALHGAYWHNGFGHRKSHGCVNLAPRDARYVYSMTTPRVPAGWASSYEHAGEPGSVVRVRKGQELGEDRRTINDVELEVPLAEAVLADRRP